MLILGVAANKRLRRIIIMVLLAPILFIFLVLVSPFAIFFSLGEDGKDTVSYLNDWQQSFLEDIKKEKDDDEDGDIDETKVIYVGSDNNTFIDNSNDVLMIYAVIQNEKNHAQVFSFSSDDVKKLRKLFYQMNYYHISNQVEKRTRTVTTKSVNIKTGQTSTSTSTEEYSVIIKYIEVYALSADDMASLLTFSDRQKDTLSSLIDSGLYYGVGSGILSSAEIEKIRQSCQGRNITGDDIVSMAMTLKGKVHYFWGGKFDKKGVNPNWGKMRKVTSAGSRTTGTIRPYGLDCSGYVTWVFINLDLPLEAIGHGARNQNAKCQPVLREQVRAGDFAFLTPTGRKHIGIVTGFDTDGEILVIHESSGINNVAISRASDIGFRYFKRHAILLEDIEEDNDID